MRLLIVVYICLIIFIEKTFGYALYFTLPSNCSKGSSTAAAEFFNIATLLCEPCTQNLLYQRQSDDGLSCICQPGYRTKRNFGGNSIECEACDFSQTVTEDGLQCVQCVAENYFTSAKTCQSCPSKQYSTFYDIFGKILTKQQCISCDLSAQPTSTGCKTCSETIKMLRASSLNESCICPNEMVDGVCFPGITPLDSTTRTSASASDNSPVVPAVSSTLTQILPAGNTGTDGAINSFYLATQARSAVAFCSTAYKNVTACQLLANLCTLQLQTRYQLQIASYSTCSEFTRLAAERTSSRTGFTNWASDMPWIYYNPTKGSTALRETSVTNTYSPNSLLDVRLATFALDGRFLGLESAVTGGQLQLCKDSVRRMQAAFEFGTSYAQECEILADDLFNNTKYPLEFYDPYLMFYDSASASSRLMPIPILNRALLSDQNSFTNVVSDTDVESLFEALAVGNAASAVSIETSILDKWELTRRLFLVDNVVGKVLQSTTPTTLVRYVSNLEIRISPRGSSQDGLIYPPLIKVDYANLYASSDYGIGKLVKITFKVTYEQMTDQQATLEQNVRIAMGVISAMAACVAMVRTWLWSRRAGVVRLDGMLVLKLLLLAAGNVANGFLIVIYCLSIYFLIFFKIQKVYMVQLPNSDGFMLSYVAAALALKFLDLVHLLAVQCNVDVFFIDWEHPKTRTTKAIRSKIPEANTDPFINDDIEGEESEAFQSAKFAEPESQYVDSGVSVWRTIYVANEWNEIQTHRKTSSLITFASVLFFMKVVGFENLASTDAHSRFTVDPLQYQSEDSRIFRIALILSIMLITGIVQWFLLIAVWERCSSDRLRSFADLCSVSNVSMFILSQANFGYYIHGHSPTGRSDLDLGGLAMMLAAENVGVAARRGITTDSDDHTYRMALPSAFRQAFNRLYEPLLSGARVGPKSGKNKLGFVNFTTIEVYQALNRFLIRFISRDDPDGLRYRIVRRRALEDILDGEFEDTTYEGLFYLDDGNSFGDVLYYGNEILLFVFDALLFCLVDLLGNNLILDALIALLVSTIICQLRSDLGRRNLARKTMIDERFLI
ncbi:Meckelin [Fasciola hepatica]|uniref:Meckelin n=1 Tax=Fasciola hepatica TaxID=6192 RepID=A0A4E0RHG7_FASHE|nr:Meckelin [Fasciola hepatica]